MVCLNFQTVSSGSGKTRRGLAKRDNMHFNAYLGARKIVHL
jgi:hypothetical protein